MFSKQSATEAAVLPATAGSARRALQFALLAAVILGLNAVLNAVLFLPGERLYRGSIEPGYVSMARFVAEHPNPWGWKPEQYCGIPSQFVYLPLLPYVTAVWIWMLQGIEPEQVYRVITVAIACFGPVIVFIFAAYFSKSRWWAFATALVYTVFSPMCVLSSGLRLDAGIAQLPSRLHVQIKYGEAPHNAGLVLIPLALVALHAAGRGRRYWQILLAAVLIAAVALTNWVAMLVLAWCSLMLVWSAVRSATLDRFRAGRAIYALVLAYLLACFWLTPEFIKTTILNWPADAFGYMLTAQARVSLLVLMACILVLRLVLDRLGAGAYLTFLTLCFFSFTAVVLGYYWFRFEATPEARRYAPEADLFAVLLYFELARRAWQSRKRVWIDAAVGVAVAAAFLGAPQVWRYATKPFQELRPYPKETTPEYRVARFLADSKPQGRVFVAGGTRYHLNSWFAVPQTGGIFDSGLKNRTPLHFQYQIQTGEGTAPMQEGHAAVLQLRAMGAEYVAVHGPESKEYYRDFRNASKFEGLLERVYHQDNDSIYRLPFTSYAVLVKNGEVPQRLPTGRHVQLLEPFVAAIDDSGRPKLRSTWNGTDELVLEGSVPEGFSAAVHVTYDPGWTATQDNRPLTVGRNAMGFIMLNPAPAAETRIVLRYNGTLEQKLMAGISLVAWLSALAGVVIARRRRLKPLPNRPIESA
jgi:hypothetical protein